MLSYERSCLVPGGSAGWYKQGLCGGLPSTTIKAGVNERGRPRKD